MIKEELYNTLRNSTRQRRYMKSYFYNLKTVFAEAANVDCISNSTDRPINIPALEPC